MTRPLGFALLAGVLVVVLALVARSVQTPDGPYETLHVRHRTVTETGYLTAMALTGPEGEARGDFLLVTRLAPDMRPFVVEGRRLPSEAKVVRFEEIYHLYPRAQTVFDSTHVKRDTVIVSVDLRRQEIWVAPGHRQVFSAGGAYLLDLAGRGRALREIERPQGLAD